MNSNIQTSSLEQGYQKEFLDNSFPSSLKTWHEEPLALNNGSTHFGYVYNGSAQLTCASGSFTLNKGMYFSVPGECKMEGTGSGIVMTRHSFQGFFQIGGPVEKKGRLRYISGCTDSLLIPPVLKGDACLNLLHVPAQTNQKQHTHPSLRIGLVVNGEGVCRNPESESQLSKGTLFIIPTDVLHSFHTKETDLKIIVYHPESDFGPTHEIHPMINRTVFDKHLNHLGEDNEVP